VKNPLGYISWKTYRWINPPPRQILIYGGLLYWGSVIFYWKQISEEYKEIDEVLKNYGKNVEGTSGRMKGYHNQKMFHKPNMI